MYYLVLFSSPPVRYIGPGTLSTLQNINQTFFHGNGHIYKHMSCLKTPLRASNLASIDKFLEERRAELNLYKERLSQVTHS